MAGRPPKPAHLRQNRTKKSTHATLDSSFAGDVPAIPNPDAREWHALTLESWKLAWQSPMASQYLPADVPAMGRLAVLWDDYYREPKAGLAAEIRLQEMRFGLTPLDRSRLQWEVARGDEAERRRPKGEPAKKATGDPRAFLKAV